MAPSLYLALLIGPLLSTLTYALLRSVAHVLFPSLSAQRAESASRPSRNFIVQAGSMRYSAFGTVAVACSRSDWNKVVQALTALSSSKDGSRQDSGHSLFRGPARGRSPRARISVFAPLQSTVSYTNDRQFSCVWRNGITAPASVSASESPWRRTPWPMDRITK